jgi:hypothetical protein
VLRSGATATGCDNADKLLDGDATNYDGGSGFASYDMSANPNGAIVITLAKKTSLNRVRFLLWDKDDRTYRYIVSVSPDNKAWKVLKDCSKLEMRSWQQIDFDAQDVLAIKIKGLGNTANSGFHIVEVEAYSNAPPVPRRLPPQTPAPTSEGGVKPGIWAEYYDGVSRWPTVEDRPTVTRVESALNFGSTPQLQPGQGLQNWPLAGGCAAIFSGLIKIDKNMLYTFFVDCDDGAVLYIDGELVVDNDGPHPYQGMWGQAELTAGLHRFWLVYYNVNGPMGLNVWIKPKGGDRNLIAPTQLFYEPNDAAKGQTANSKHPAPAVAVAAQ